MSGKQILLRMERLETSKVMSSFGINDSDEPEATHTPPPTADQGTADHSDTLRDPAAVASDLDSTTKPIAILDKGGHIWKNIGIYSPEARKARIAKFHSKRKTRVWRKRIKYDVRKKLADSRPRIKGRFVKRSDKEYTGDSHENGCTGGSTGNEEAHI